MAKKQKVKVGIQDARYIEIIEGIDSSSKVIIGPFDAVSQGLKDGLQVYAQRKGKAGKFGAKKRRRKSRKKE